MSSIEAQLAAKAEYTKQNIKLSELLKSKQHCDRSIISTEPLTLDFSRQLIDDETFDLLIQLAKSKGLDQKINDMAAGKHINVTEDRAVGHMALRAGAILQSSSIPSFNTEVDSSRPSAQLPPDEFMIDGQPAHKQAQEVLEQIKTFSERVRSGDYLTADGTKFKTFLIIGIGGSYLGTKFVYEAIKHDNRTGVYSAGLQQGYSLRFLANVDPVDVSRALEGIDPSTTMAIIISKTFTTAETMMNAETIKQWLQAKIGPKLWSKHMIACSTAIDKVTAFGLNPLYIFPFWDWVGGRYSVSSTVGMLPLSLCFGYNISYQFLCGARDMDRHFMTSPYHKNIPILLGLIGIWNSQYLGYSSRCIAPYSEALLDFTSHIQQVDMESNGKYVHIDGSIIQHTTGEIDFGVPGTNSQHSYFQLLHQGRVIPVDFIGSIYSQYDQYSNKIKYNNDNNTNTSANTNTTIDNKYILSNHDELMANFFAQPDALAYGRSYNDIIPIDKQDTITSEQHISALHRVMPGNRPSNIILLDQLTPYHIGLLLSLYEHRTAVQGWIWDLNSFDQYGVELGKVLANKVRNSMINTPNTTTNNNNNDFCYSTSSMLKRYMSARL